MGLKSRVKAFFARESDLLFLTMTSDGKRRGKARSIFASLRNYHLGISSIQLHPKPALSAMTHNQTRYGDMPYLSGFSDPSIINMALIKWRFTMLKQDLASGRMAKTTVCKKNEKHFILYRQVGFNIDLQYEIKKEDIPKVIKEQKNFVILRTRLNKMRIPSSLPLNKGVITRTGLSVKINRIEKNFWGKRK